MPKLKTKSSVKKRFRMRGDGTITHKSAGRRHHLRQKSSDRKRKLRGSSEIDKTDEFHVLRCARYGLR